MSVAETKTRHPGVYRRGDRYAIRYRDRMGRSRRRYAETMAEALDLQARLAEDNGPSAESRVRFKEYAEAWLLTYKGRTRRGLRDATLAEYKRVVDGDAMRFFGRMRLADVKPQDVRRYAAEVAGRGVSDNTVRLALAPVRLIFRTAYEDGAIQRDPCAGVRIAQPEQATDEDAEVKVLTDEQLGRLIEKTPAEYRLLVVLLATTGLRISEALALRWSDVDLGRGRLHVSRRVYRGSIAPPKSRYGRRSVPLTPSVTRDLWTRRKGAESPAEDDLIFPSRTGGFLSANNVARRAFKPAAAAAGVSWASFHTLRHGYATRLFDNGWNAKQAQLALGHHSPAFTLSVYVHGLSDDLPTPMFLDGLRGDTQVTQDEPKRAETKQAARAANPAISG